jgi:predicted GTPase
MKTVRTGALLIPMCDAQQQELQDEEIRNEVKSAFSKDAISEIQHTAPTASSRVPKIKGRNAMFIEQETRVLHSARGNNEEDLNFFWSLIAYVKQLPPQKKSYF